MALFRRKTPNEDGNPSIDPPPDVIEKSILFLCANKSEIGINKWFILPPGADSLKKCLTISDQVWKNTGYYQTDGVIIGAYLYVIGGISHRRSKFDSLLWSRAIRRINILNPEDNWEIQYVLPFYCWRVSLVVSGDLIFIFRDNYERFNSNCFTRETYLYDNNWAFVYHTQEKNGWFISHPYSETRDDFPKCDGFLPPSANSRDLGDDDDDDDSGSDIDSCDEFHSPDFRITWPLFCGAVDWGNGHKVFVQLDDGVYFYDPCQKYWYPHSQTQTQSSNSLIEDIYHTPRKFTKTVPLVSGEIVYFLCFWWGGLLTKHALIAYNLREGKRLFELEVDSLCDLGNHDYLFEIGDFKLCWISVHYGVYSKIFFSTTMLIRYHPIPCIEIQKKRRFEVPNSHFACCVSVDLSLVDIKLMTESEVPGSGPLLQGSCCSNNSTVPGCLSSDRPKIGASSSGNTMPEKPEKSILLLACMEEKGESVNRWFKLSPTVDLSVENRISSKLWELGYSHTQVVVIESYLYIIGGLSHDNSEKANPPQRIMSNMIIRTDLDDSSSNIWEQRFKLPFYCYTSNVAVCGNLIYIFEGIKRFSSTIKYECRIDSRDWAYVYDTELNDGWFISQPPSLGGEGRRPMVRFCAAVNWGYGVDAKGPVVVVYMENEFYIHDPDSRTWKCYVKFNSVGADVVFGRRNEDVVAEVVTGGILYYLHYDWRLAGENKANSELKPTLTAYDIKRGNHLFHLEVDSVGLGLAPSTSSCLVAVGDFELCWIEYESIREGIFVTKIAIRSKPRPKLVILKKKKFHAGVSFLACCLPIDSSSEE